MCGDFLRGITALLFSWKQLKRGINSRQTSPPPRCCLVVATALPACEMKYFFNCKSFAKILHALRLALCSVCESNSRKFSIFHYFYKTLVFRSKHLLIVVFRGDLEMRAFFFFFACCWVCDQINARACSAEVWWKWVFAGTGAWIFADFVTHCSPAVWLL